MVSNITQERAAQRFHQMQVLEQQYAMKGNEIAECQAHLKELKEEQRGIGLRMRTAARDEGELPLFDIDS